MHTLVLILIFQVLGTFVLFTDGINLKGCSIAKTLESGDTAILDLSEFEHNAPKKAELIRTKAYFRNEIPSYGSVNNGNVAIFGKFY